MKLFSLKASVLFIFLGCLTSNLFAFMFVSPQHEYYPLVQKIIFAPEGEDDDALQRLQVGNEKEETIKRILIVMRKMEKYAKQPNGYEAYNATYDDYCKLVAEAYGKYPDDAVIVTLFACVVLYDIPGKYIFHDTRDCRFQDRNKYTAIIGNLVPLLGEKERIPRIVNTLWLVFKFLESNRDGNDYSISTDFTQIYAMLGIFGEKDDNSNLLAIKNYWGSQVDLSYITTPRKRQELEKAREWMQIPGNKDKATAIWKTFLARAMADHAKRMELARRIRLEAQASAVAEEKKAATKQAPPAEALVDEQLQKKLDELKTKQKWSMVEVEIYFSGLMKFSRQLKGNADLPNKEELKALYQDSDEVEMLNLWYKYCLPRSFEEVLESIDRRKDWEKDSRLVLLKLVCARNAKRSKEEQLELVEILIKLEPNQPRFQHLKEMLEEK